MPASLFQLVGDPGATSVKKDEFHVRVYPQQLAIFSFQRRTCQHRVLIGRERSRDRFAQTLQPRLSILVRQRFAPLDLVDVSDRMKIVGVVKFPVKLLGKLLTNCRFAGAGNSPNDHDHRLLCPS